MSLSQQLREHVRSRAPAVVMLLGLLVVMNMGYSALEKGMFFEETRFLQLDEAMARRALAANLPEGYVQPEIIEPPTHVEVVSGDALSSQQQSGAAPTAPHPPPRSPCNRLPRHYLFGYGSLVNVRSRAKTAQTGASIPVRVRGLERAWDYAQPRRSMTALGVVFREDATTNGVLVMVAEKSLPKFDEREVKYTRNLLPHDAIEIVRHKDRARPEFCLHPEDKVWTYVVDQPLEPTCPLPIAQSYVDVVMEGFLDFGEDFAREFVRTTKNWDDLLGSKTRTWVNDRSAPLMYQKGFVPAKTERHIDAILKDLVPNELADRRDISMHECSPKQGV